MDLNNSFCGSTDLDLDFGKNVVRITYSKHISSRITDLSIAMDEVREAQKITVVG